MTKTLLVIFVLGLGIATGYTASSLLFHPIPAFSAALPQAVAVFETSLASPISSSATTMTLTANVIRGGGALSGYNCFTVDEGSAQAETICGSVSGTTVSTLSRGISQATGTTTVAALQFAHRRGANVKISDFPLIQILKAQANGEDTFPNPLTYTSGQHPCSVSSASTTICDKNYSDSLVAAGASPGSNTVAGLFLSATGLQAASSTATGTYNATTYQYVLPASIATDTPNTATRGSRALMSDITGFLKQGWLDLSAAFTVTGNWIFQGTVNILASVAKPLTLNAISYVFPASQGVATSTLINDGSGNLSWQSVAWVQLVSTTTTVAMPFATTTFPSMNNLMFIYQQPQGATNAGLTTMRFNGDGGTNYGSVLQNLGGDAGSQLQGATPSLSLVNTSTTSPMYIMGNVMTASSTVGKYIQWRATMADAFNHAPMTITGSGAWANTTSKVNTIVFAQGGAAGIPVGTIIEVFGAN